MLTPADRALLARDSAVPGMALLLDDERLAELLAGPGGPGGEVRVEYLRYKPGTSLTAGLLLDGPHGAGRAFAVAGSAQFAAKLPKMLGRHRSTRRRPLATEPGRHVVVAPMDQDPELPALHREMAGVRRPLPDRLRAGPLQVLRYRPLRRAVVVAGARGGPRAVVRAVEPGALGAGLTRARLAAARDLPVAPLLGHSRRRGVVASAYVEGTVPVDGTTDLAVQQQAGALLAGWHREARTERLPVADVAATLRSTAALVGHLLPELAGQAERAAHSVGPRLGTLGRHGRIVHGDFSVDQLVLTSHGPVLLDLDRMRVDAPHWDVATWFAAEVVGGRAPADGDPQVVLAGLLAAYEDAGGADLRCGLRAYAAAALLLRSAEPFRNRHADWAGRTAELVTAAARLAAVPV